MSSNRKCRVRSVCTEATPEDCAAGLVAGCDWRPWGRNAKNHGCYMARQPPRASKATHRQTSRPMPKAKPKAKPPRSKPPATPKNPQTTRQRILARQPPWCVPHALHRPTTKPTFKAKPPETESKRPATPKNHQTMRQRILARPPPWCAPQALHRPTFKAKPPPGQPPAAHKSPKPRNNGCWRDSSQALSCPTCN